MIVQGLERVPRAGVRSWGATLEGTLDDAVEVLCSGYRGAGEVRVQVCRCAGVQVCR